MSRRIASIDPDYFEDLYAKDPDPWRFGSSAYERDKYADTLAQLGRASYPRALEVGCSIGIFTRLLAPRCGALLAIDPSAHALASAREACRGLATVSFEQRRIPAEMPEGPFDLIVLSEVLYYLDRTDAERTARLCCERLAPSGEAVLCHWLGETDYPLTGEQAAEIFVQSANAHDFAVETIGRAEYRLDRVARAAP